MVIVTSACAVVAVAALVGLWRLLVVLRRVTQVLDSICDEALPLVEHLSASVEDANAQLERVNRLVGSAESISATVDATSKLAYRALSAPVIKTVAVTSGASRAAKRMRRQ